MLKFVIIIMKQWYEWKYHSNLNTYFRNHIYIYICSYLKLPSIDVVVLM